MMNGKAFVGLWINEATRRKFKAACALHNINQGDVMDLLLQNWLKKPQVQDEFKKLNDGRTKN